MRSRVTTTRTSVSYGVGSPGFGDCCVSFNTGASRHTGSSSRPSSTIEAEGRTTASTLGPSLARASANPVAARTMQKSQTHFCVRRILETNSPVLAERRRALSLIRDKSPGPNRSLVHRGITGDRPPLHRHPCAQPPCHLLPARAHTHGEFQGLLPSCGPSFEQESLRASGSDRDHPFGRPRSPRSNRRRRFA